MTEIVSSRVKKNKKESNDFHEVTEDNSLQLNSIREIRSPKGFKITSQLSKSGKGLEKLRANTRISKRPNKASYFA